MRLEISFGVGLLIVNSILCQDWPSPHFKDAEIEGIEFVDQSDIPFIRLREEIDYPFKLIIINYKGTSTPEIGGFQIGNNNLLKATIVKGDDGYWFLQINDRQDYENEKQRLYQFDININKESNSIFISLQNIFDNAPTVTYNGPCKAEELHADWSTNCTFRVYDADGMANNEITLTITGSYNEDRLFGFRDFRSVDEFQRDYDLYVIEELHYEQRMLYNFYVTAYDIAGNNKSLPTILEVIDLPNMNPVWVKLFATATFKEKSAQEFTVQAVDGDTGINKKIWYRLEFNPNEDYSDLMSIDKETGVLRIKPINRDPLETETFTFSICAYKFDNYTWALCNTSVLIVQDINDNLPLITIEPVKVSFLEETSLTVPFTIFSVNDMDWGNHATYEISLQQSGKIFYSKAFDVIPNAGYRKADFKLTVIDAPLLDYEEKDWRSFTITIKAQETYFPENKTVKSFDVELINWNDEIPEFKNAPYSVSLKETIPAKTKIATVQAEDRDVNDRVTHEIVGLSQGIHITPDGLITTIANDTLDYERQTTVILQIKATDTLQTAEKTSLHTVYTQLTINVIDVNDETPEIRMPRNSPNITENTIDTNLIITTIQALDPDTTADLVFQILWNESYAIKSGKAADSINYANCFIIERNNDNRNNVSGYLKVNPDFYPKLIDYEMYENIYLTIKVTDLNQEVNEGTAVATLTIRVDDLNDNRPRFIKDTLRTQRAVIEEAVGGTLVGTIYAEDIDGPGNNEIDYSIKPLKDKPGTDDGLIEIDPATGELKVMKNSRIDCDEKCISGLNFTILLFDHVEPKTEGNIFIEIFDINNKIPQVLEFDRTVSIWENSTTGTYVTAVKAHDDDRDAPHNALLYSINNPTDVRKYFEIDEQKGEIIVKLQPGIELDRDNGQPNHAININIQDNYLGTGRTNSNETSVLVILRDVNDNAPEMPKPDDFAPIIEENAKQGENIGGRFIAPDKDEPNTPNSWVSYKIVDIKPVGNNPDSVKDFENLFKIEGDDKEYGQIFANKPLKGFYGTWLVTILAYDHGDEGDTRLSLKSTETYKIYIRPYNFYSPKIIFPNEGVTIRLRYNGQEQHKPLYTTESSYLRLFEAYDPDGEQYGNVTFEISSYDVQSDDAKYFEVIQESRSTSRLQITQDIKAKFYGLNIKAVDGGFKSSEILTNQIVVFVDMEGEPIFKNREYTTNFTENEFGLEELRYIPEADDPKNNGILNEKDKFKIYYFIDNKFNPLDAELFKLDEKTRQLSLTKELDRESIDTHQIRIIATNREKEPPTNPDENSFLLVTVTVNDVNDNPPTFDESHYGAGITTSDYATKLILTVHATDPDLDDPTTYLINQDSIIAKGQGIEDVKKDMFELNESTGDLRLLMSPRNNMKGYFEFDIIALDTVNHTDQANVKIYIVSESNRVTFVFLSSFNVVKNNVQYMKEKFQELYGYEICNIDEIIPQKGAKQATNSTDSVESTTVRAHFIQNNEAIEASEIQKKSSDINFIAKLKKSLIVKDLVLNDVPLPKFEDVAHNMESMLTTILVVVSVVLGSLCIVLIVAFVMRTRALDRQLKAFAPPEFGSTPSNLNRIGAPTTNVFSVEGSNPVLNDNEFTNDVYDDMSVDSYESDFIGINNDPTFMMNEDEINSQKKSSNSSNTSNLSETRNNVLNNLSSQVIENNQIEKF